MQIMNLTKLLKDFWWILTAFKTIDNLPESVIFTDKEGNIKNFNKRAKEVFILDNLSDNAKLNISSVIKDGVSCILSSAENSKPVLGKAFVGSREFYVEISAVKKGKNYYVSIRDMSRLTAELDNEDKILKFNNEKNAMLAKLEGDLKSPLTSISGFSQGLLDGLGGSLTEKQAKYVKIIHSNSEELYNFIDKLLEFSMAESLIYEADYQKFDIVEASKNILKDYEKEIQSKKIEIGFDYNGLEKRTVYTDKNAVTRIIKNIIETSVSMSESGGTVVLKLFLPDEITAQHNNINDWELKSYIQITIADNSAGIADEDMKFLCEPYAQIEKGKKNFLRALKLGSASILTKRAGGFINITSKVMEGVRYDVILPIVKV